MVLESLTSPFSAKRAPWKVFFLGALYSTIAMFLSYWIFKEYASLIMIFIIAITCVPLLYKTMKVEEQKDIVIDSELGIIKEHAKTISFLMVLFCGFVAAFVFWYIVMPKSFVHTIFKSQVYTIQAINVGTIQGSAINISTFTTILFNNVKVLIFCILFAFLFGAGAIFILSWNASVIATAMGNFIRHQFANYTHLIGFEKVASYLQVTSLGIFRYALHGVPEIASYFIAGLVGGIISVAIIREHFGTKKFQKILIDAADLLLIALLLLVVAAAIEVYVTPLLF